MSLKLPIDSGSKRPAPWYISSSSNYVFCCQLPSLWAFCKHAAVRIGRVSAGFFKDLYMHTCMPNASGRGTLFERQDQDLVPQVCRTRTRTWPGLILIDDVFHACTPVNAIICFNCKLSSSDDRCTASGQSGRTAKATSHNPLLPQNFVSLF